MSYTYQELKKKTVVQLREIASGIEDEAVKGFTQLNKEHLIKAICQALKISIHQHHQAVVVNKSTIKKMIKVMKSKRDSALENRNPQDFKIALREIHRLKRQIKHSAH